MDGRIEYCRDGTGRGDTPLLTTAAATPSETPTTNSIDGGTEYHRNGIKHSDSDDCYLVSGSNDGNDNTDSGSDDETSNKSW